MIASPTPQIRIMRHGALRIIELNRPEALNALTLEMVRAMTAALEAYEHDPAVGLVVVRGAGERGLCAGGDIRTLYNSVRANDGWVEDFWREEYALNARIARFPKPCVAIMDGFVMGGGVGISAHASHRIVTERTKFAMPETAIGLMPDVGTTYLLPKAPGEAGTCLALTSMTANANDAIYTGFADYLVPSSELSALQEDLVHLPATVSNAGVASIIEAYAVNPDSSILNEERALIDRCMAADRIETIEEELARAATPYAKELLDTLRTRSPTALKVTLALLRKGRTSASLAECLNREFTAMMHAASQHDPIEGIRAAVIDKDRNPKWNPSQLAAVTDNDVSAFFAASGREPLDLSSFRETSQ